MSKNRYDFVFRFRVIASMLTIGLFVLTSSVTAQVVERYNAAGTLTASGSDVGAVQTSSGAAEGDVLILSGTTTHNAGIDQRLLKFTIQSATTGTKQTINASTTGRLYNFNDGAKTYDITLKDLDYQGAEAAVGNAIGLFMHTSPACTLDINTDNVSFTGFKNAGYHGGVFGIDGSGNLKITATNGLVFDSNRSNASTGGAIHVNAGTFTITADTLTFKNNYAQTYGGAIKAASGTLTADTILFEGNNTANNDAGAIYASGSFTINGSSADAVTTVNNNYTKYKGGAIRCDGTLTLKTGTFNFTNNYNTTSSDKYSYGGAIHTESINTDAKKINFDSNKSTYYGGGLSVNGGTLKADTIIFNKNTSDNRGGAIFTNGSLTITGNTIKFTDNFANNFGGAIFNNNGDSTLTINGKDVLFSGNHISANDSGSIHGGNVTLNGMDADSVFTFKENYSKYYGAAINSNAVSLSTGTFKFTGNYETASDSRYSYGGAISCSSITANAKTLNFDSNTSRYYGGAISVSGSGGTMQADTITFNKNKADLFGGAIHLKGGTLTIKGDDVKFTDNSVTSANGDGGAIRGVDNATVVFTGLDEESVTLFSGNKSTRYGGALSVTAASMSTGSFTFENNSTGTQGGAIYAESVTFSGDGTVGTFTGNAAGVGNDIYLINASSVLSFQGAGTYSFDGGIVLAAETAQTVVNQAQVTIAGREGDSSNVYQLQNVSISNGGKLTAELDNVNSATGTFTLDNSSSVLEFKTDSADASRFDNTIAGSGTILKTGSGTLALNGTDDNPISASSMTVNEGSLLFKGYYTGDLTIKDGTLFSPGNSVGTLTMDGDFTADAWSTLFFEQDSTGIDQLIILSGGKINISDDAVLELAMTSPVPGATYTLIDVADGLSGDYATADFWNGILSPESGYYWNLSVDGNHVFASIDANAVPEPSTWALLALGVIVLYLRKRVRS